MKAPEKIFPGPAPNEAVDYIRNKGWKPGWDYRDVWREEHAVAFTVAKATQMDVLQAIRTEVERVITDGITLREFQRTLTPTLQKLGWWGRQAQTDPLTGKTLDVQLGSPRRLKLFMTSTAGRHGQPDNGNELIALKKHCHTCSIRSDRQRNIGLNTYAGTAPCYA